MSRQHRIRTIRGHRTALAGCAALVLALGVSACGSDEPDEPTTPTAAPTTSATQTPTAAPTTTLTFNPRSVAYSFGMFANLGETKLSYFVDDPDPSHKLLMITVADLIRYRMRTEGLVQKVAEALTPDDPS